MLYQEIREISLRSGKSQGSGHSRKPGHPVKFKQIFLTQFNQNFLHPISYCDSSPVRLNSLNDLEEIALLFCITEV